MQSAKNDQREGSARHRQKQAVLNSHQHRLKQVTDPLNGNTYYGYNALDQLISVTDPRSKVTSYTYNALGDLTQQVSPDTGTTTNTYDAAGNLLTTTDARKDRKSVV